MPPFPASLGGLVHRSASPTAIPNLSVSPSRNKRRATQQPPYLNSTSHRVSSRAEYNLTSRAEHNLTARADNITVRSTSAEHISSFRPERIQTSSPEAINFITRSGNNLTVRSGHYLITSPRLNITARSEDLDQHSTINITSSPANNLTARSDLNLTTLSVPDSAVSPSHNLTRRTDLSLTESSEGNLTNPKMIIRNANYNPSGLTTDLSFKDVQTIHHLATRATTTYTPCVGCTDPSHINNKAFFALFAILGVAMVVVSIWFFFHAKNGGFQWQENDWDDYKSTVLRRKGPDGKTLSNATKSTRLGGGSIIARHDRLAAMTVVGYDEKGRKGIRAKRGFGGTHSVYYSDDFSQYTGSRADDMSEAGTLPGHHRTHRGGDEKHDSGKHHAHRYRDRDVQHYRKEKPARVGGMNKPADGSNYDFSDTMTQITESTNRSTANLIKDHPRDQRSTDERKRVKAEKKAHDEAARMERKWRKEAEAAARAIARENAPSPVPPQQAHRKRGDSRSGSLKKRDYSFSNGQDEIATAYSGESGNRSSSYYDAYRPKNTERAASKSRQGSPSKGYRRYAESEAATSDTGTRIYEHKLNKGPAKEKKPAGARGGRDVMAGYRRGRGDDSEEDF